jgi:hypothetical protein
MATALGPHAGMQGTSLESAFLENRVPAEAFSIAQRRVIAAWLKTYWQLTHGKDSAPSQLAAQWSDDRE